MLQLHHPGFSCPLCVSQLAIFKAVYLLFISKRTFHDLEADVEVEDAWDVASRRASVRRESSQVVDPDPLVAAIVSAGLPAVPSGSPENTSRNTINAIGELPILNPVLATETTDGDNGDVHMSSGYTPERIPDDLNEDALEQSNSIPVPQSGRQLSGAGMSLGGLRIPQFNDPSATLNPNYAGLDAATPMNTTFLSTLAESPVDPAGGSSLLPRLPARLDDVGEGEEETDEVRLREPAEHLYT